MQHLEGPALAARVMLAYDQALGPLVHFPEARLLRRAALPALMQTKAFCSRAMAAFACLVVLRACSRSRYSLWYGLFMAATLYAFVVRSCARMQGSQSSELSFTIPQVTHALSHSHLLQ